VITRPNVTRELIFGRTAAIEECADGQARRIQALEAQVNNLLRTKDPTHTAQQALPEGYAVPDATPSTTSTGDGDVVDEDIITIDKADTLVEMYKTEMMPHFPFVIISPQDTAERLRAEKPLTFLAVMTVASFHDLPAQEQLGNRFKHMVTDKVLYGGDDCLKLEYLQGLLIILAWYELFNFGPCWIRMAKRNVGINITDNRDSSPSTSCWRSPLR